MIYFILLFIFFIAVCYVLNEKINDLSDIVEDITKINNKQDGINQCFIDMIAKLKQKK